MLSHYPCTIPDNDDNNQHGAHLPTATAVTTMHGDIRIQFKGADGTIRAKVFHGLDKVYVLSEVVEEGVKKGGEREI